jgi:hypothetical protein
MYRVGRLNHARALSALVPLAMLAVCDIAVGQTSIFSYPNGFANASNAFQMATDANRISGSAIQLTDGAPGQHESGAAWYKSQQVNISSFTTDFTFQVASGLPVPSIVALTFCIQNSNASTNPPPPTTLGYGINVAGDANMAGYGAYWWPSPSGYQHPIGNSIAIKFDLNNANTFTNAYPASGAPNSIGLYIDGGPSAALMPEQDLNPSGINLYSGHVMAAHVVYDGTLLTLTLRDTVTNVQYRTSWPVNIPAIVGGNSAWVGFTAGEITPVTNSLLTWSFSQGYAPRLATPTFSTPAGSYTSGQTVSMGAPAGATIYYTTNGLQPTTSSKQYTGPISVSSSQIVQAIAVQSGSTDSLVAQANYQIAPSGTPLINFPSGFGNSSGLLTTVGAALINSSGNLQLTDTGRQLEVGAAWYPVPVNVQSFTTNFTLLLTSPVQNGLTFCIQNQPPSSSDTSIRWVSGGPTAMSNSEFGLGYSGGTESGQYSEIAGLLSSVAVKFDLYAGTGNDTGLYTNGADLSQNGVSMNSSGVSLHAGHPLAVSLTYNGTTLSMTIKDTVSNATYSNSWNINIPQTVGGNTAYVGFTASTSYNTATQNITAWTFAPAGQSTTQAPATPMPPTNLSVN